jgi:hypothetical protein
VPAILSAPYRVRGTPLLIISVELIILSEIIIVCKDPENTVSGIHIPLIAVLIFLTVHAQDRIGPVNDGIHKFGLLIDKGGDQPVLIEKDGKCLVP